MKKNQKVEEFIKYVEEIKDADGFAVVDINVNADELYDPMSMGSNRDLNGEIYDFIDEQTNIVPANIPLKIRMHGNVPADKHEEIRRMMKRHYTMKSYDVTWDVAANLRKMIVLTVLGVILLAAYFYFEFTSDIFFAEILSILGSFSLWEAADSLLLERPRLRRERRNIEQNINQIVEFIDDKENEKEA